MDTRTDPAAVRVGDLMAFTYWAKVKQTVGAGSSLAVVNVDNGEDFHVRGVDLVSIAASADYHDKDKVVTMTEAADILVNIPHAVPFTVVFQKADGEVRKLRGRRLGSTTLGRSQVEDLDISHTENRLRQVDHRTIRELIVGGVRYTVKGKP